MWRRLNVAGFLTVLGLGQSCALSSFGSRRAVLTLGGPAATLSAMVASGESASATTDGVGLVRRGMELFTRGDVAGSLEAFDAARAAEPSLSNKLWQRGLSLYYVGRYAEAAAQFESDVALNPNDTEESIWHWLSVARETGGLSDASARLLKVGRDRRPVMRAVYAMFEAADSDDGPTKRQAVVDIAERSISPGERFYAALYLGLFAEANRDDATSRAWIQRAVGATDYYASTDDYMYALARVHAQQRAGLLRPTPDL